MVPIRCCVACKCRKEKKDFTRIVANNEGKAIIDKNQNINSRGIYICKEKKCINNLKEIAFVHHFIYILRIFFVFLLEMLQ